jgi:hypothetical protein
MAKSLLPLAAAFFLVAASAQGQANLTFSGGNGSPLSLTLTQPVTFTINIAGPSNGPIFDFQNLGGGNQAFSQEGSGLALGAIAANDVYANGSFVSLNLGDVVLLHAGTLTTTPNFAAAPPANGSYNAFITNTSGTRASANGVAVPEPQSAAFFALGGLALLWWVMRKRAHSVR